MMPKLDSFVRDIIDLSWPALLLISLAVQIWPVWLFLYWLQRR